MFDLKELREIFSQRVSCVGVDKIGQPSVLKFEPISETVVKNPNWEIFSFEMKDVDNKRGFDLQKKCMESMSLQIAQRESEFLTKAVFDYLGEEISVVDLARRCSVMKYPHLKTETLAVDGVEILELFDPKFETVGNEIKYNRECRFLFAYGGDDGCQ